MRRIAAVVFAFGLLTACSSKASPPPAAPAPAAPPPTAAPAPAPAPDAPLTRDECAQMIGHIVDIGVEQQKRSKKPEQVPTEEQVATIRAQMVESMTDQCLQYDRPSWRCAMDATSEADLDVCAQAGGHAGAPK